MEYHESEVGLHNSEEDGYWIILEKSVYDISRFIKNHPGGSVVLINNTGRDASEDFKRIQHHENPRIIASLANYLIGKLVIANINESSHYELYKLWLDTHYLIIEMQNTLRSDYSFLNKTCTVHGLPLELTPYKLELFLETHSRFVNGYLNLVMSRVESLNSLVPDKSQSYISTSLKFHLLICQAFIKNSASLIRKKNSDINSSHLMAQKSWYKKMNTYRTLMEENDKNIISDIKHYLIRGLKIFESKPYEINVQQHIECIESICLSIKKYSEKIESETLKIFMDNDVYISDAITSSKKELENEC